MAAITLPDTEIAAISAILRELGLPAGALSPVLAHATAVGRDADRLGLVSGQDVAHVLSRHTGDSLLFALAREPLPGETWVDVGSGAGFPGLVLACCYPETIFLLVEPQQRRAGFLDLTITTLGLSNARVAQVRAEELDPQFDVATARALAEPALAIEALRRLLLPGGTVLLAAGETASVPPGAEDLDCARPGIESPGRLFRVDESAGEA
jgi:16S rRNA (guanine527-N7)-methyltransferase